MLKICQPYSFLLKKNHHKIILCRVLSVLYQLEVFSILNRKTQVIEIYLTSCFWWLYSTQVKIHKIYFSIYYLLKVKVLNGTNFYVLWFYLIIFFTSFNVPSLFNLWFLYKIFRWSFSVISFNLFVIYIQIRQLL